jgi:hypothetical protein
MVVNMVVPMFGSFEVMLGMEIGWIIVRHGWLKLHSSADPVGWNTHLRKLQRRVRQL